MAVRCTISQHRVFKFLEWILYIGLSIVSGWFASGVVLQFFSKKTSFLQYEEKVTQYPVVTIIWMDQVSAELKTEDVVIQYRTIGMQDFEALEIGANQLYNHKYNKTEKVILDSLQKFDGRKAFRIMQTTQILRKNLPSVQIFISLNKNLTKPE